MSPMSRSTHGRLCAGGVRHSERSRLTAISEMDASLRLTENASDPALTDRHASNIPVCRHVERYSATVGLPKSKLAQERPSQGARDRCACRLSPFNGRTRRAARDARCQRAVIAPSSSHDIFSARASSNGGIVTCCWDAVVVLMTSSTSGHSIGHV